MQNCRAWEADRGDCASQSIAAVHSSLAEFIMATQSCHGSRIMTHQKLVRFRFALAAIVMATMSTPTVGSSQEFTLPESAAAPAANYAVFGIDGSARKDLPPLDCLNCIGPAPCAPCDSCHHGFLFYGSNPFGDDCVNGFNDCLHGNCGHVAAGLSRAWIRLYERCWWPFRRPHGCGCCGGNQNGLGERE